MNLPKLLINKIDNKSKTPTKAHKDDAGYDLYAHNIKKIYIHAGGNGEGLLEIKSDNSENAKARIKDRFDNNVLTLSYMERALIGTGIRATIEPGWELQIRSRSGLVLKQGLVVANQPGTIDAGYRDEIAIILLNSSRKMQSIKIGDRIAQLVPKRVEHLEIEEVADLSSSERDKGGFGSTGN